MEVVGSMDSRWLSKAYLAYDERSNCLVFCPDATSCSYATPEQPGTVADRIATALACIVTRANAVV